MRYLLLLLFISFNVFSLEVIRPDYFSGDIKLTFVRAVYDSYETIRFTEKNGREMQLVCAKNRAYGSSPEAFLEFRNFYGANYTRFKFDSDELCRELVAYVANVSGVVNEEKPFKMILNRKDHRVASVTYPSIDPYSMTGELSDLLRKEPIKIKFNEKKTKKKKDQEHSDKFFVQPLE